MITLVRTDDCRDCDAVENALEQMALAHKVVRLLPGEPPPEEAEVRVLMDDTECFEGETEIARHLDRLREFRAEWDKFQSDACYCDEEGNVL